jgi:hypothetical protein
LKIETAVFERAFAGLQQPIPARQFRLACHSLLPSAQELTETPHMVKPLCA